MSDRTARNGIIAVMVFAIGTMGGMWGSPATAGSKKILISEGGTPGATLHLAGSLKGVGKKKKQRLSVKKRSGPGVASAGGGTVKGFKGSDEELQAVKTRRRLGVSTTAGGTPEGFKGSDEELQVKGRN
ncbi:hypothetical protein RXV86_04020 [Alisedimentitalea sp. MJ-SS2]|uniref:hypothetical protein n=1 Tax=Aliisedimentitalea sp. MJ-SS2 TaxID=3049795 RepID=UPI00291033D1|nr:hypothetical protein [Alisedimentitalea sp. MJ-SS2]MDU8926545.1 hypothetical protein [Alisedimentitalea sp. MJ-SS2]